MEYTMPANSSDVVSKVGTLKAGLEFLKLYIQPLIQHWWNQAHEWQALEFGEIKQMADKAGLFK